MAGKKGKYVVVHPRLHMAVNGALQHVKAGDILSLNKEQAKRLGERVQSVKDSKPINEPLDG